MTKTRALHSTPTPAAPPAGSTPLANTEALAGLNELRRFGHEVKANAMLKFRLALVASNLAAHLDGKDGVIAVQKQLHHDFLGDDPSKAQPKDVVAFNRAIEAIGREVHHYTFTPISKADFDAILAIDQLPCAIEPLLPLRAPDPARG